MLTTRVYKYVEDKMIHERVKRGVEPEELMRRILICYRQTQEYKDWFMSDKWEREVPLKVSLLTWLEAITPKQLEAEFSSHEIIELLIQEFAEVLSSEQ